MALDTTVLEGCCSRFHLACSHVLGLSAHPLPHPVYAHLTPYR